MNNRVLWILKVIGILFLAILIPVYWHHYGPSNFLWLSDIGLFLMVLAVVIEKRWPASMVMVGIMPFEIVWNLDFFIRLLIGIRTIGISDYMFNESTPLYLRSLSLFHLAFPPVIFWLYWLWGYERKALIWMTLTMWVAFPLSWLFSAPERNINWTYLPLKNGWTWISPGWWTLLMMVILPLLVYLPTHWLLVRKAKALST